MAKSAGGTRKTSSSNPKGLMNQKAGRFGFPVLGTAKGNMTMWGFGMSYSKNLSQDEVLKEAQKYLDTGTWDRYYPKAAPDIAKQIAEDINVRGAGVSSDRQYLLTVDGARVLITQNKNYKWVAKASNASDSYKGSALSQMADDISKSLNRKKKNH